MEGIRLNKYISEAGICSRREADRLIEEGAGCWWTGGPGPCEAMKSAARGQKGAGGRPGHRREG